MYNPIPCTYMYSWALRIVQLQLTKYHIHVHTGYPKSYFLVCQCHKGHPQAIHVSEVHRFRECWPHGPNSNKSMRPSIATNGTWGWCWESHDLTVSYEKPKPHCNIHVHGNPVPCILQFPELILSFLYTCTLHSTKSLVQNTTLWLIHSFVLIPRTPLKLQVEPTHVTEKKAARASNHCWFTGLLVTSLTWF